jgi:hypothetical protein
MENRGASSTIAACSVTQWPRCVCLLCTVCVCVCLLCTVSCVCVCASYPPCVCVPPIHRVCVCLLSTVCVCASYPPCVCARRMHKHSAASVRTSEGQLHRSNRGLKRLAVSLSMSMCGAMPRVLTYNTRATRGAHCCVRCVLLRAVRGHWHALRTEPHPKL